MGRLLPSPLVYYPPPRRHQEVVESNGFEPGVLGLVVGIHRPSSNAGLLKCSWQGLKQAGQYKPHWPWCTCLQCERVGESDPHRRCSSVESRLVTKKPDSFLWMEPYMHEAHHSSCAHPCSKNLFHSGIQHLDFRLCSKSPMARDLEATNIRAKTAGVQGKYPAVSWARWDHTLW